MAALNAGFKFIAINVSHPRYREELLKSNPDLVRGIYGRSDLALPSNNWCNLVVLKLSQWIDVDSPNEMIRKTAEKVMWRELTYASHCGVKGVIVNLKGPRCVNMARLLGDYILSTSAFQVMFHVWIALPMEWPGVQSARHLCQASGDKADDLSDTEEPSGDQEPWEWWNLLRNISGTDKRIGVALRLSADLPSEKCLRRWLGEPVRCLIVPTSLFTTNKKGYPVLPKPHQNVIMRFFKLECQVMVEGSCHHDHMKLYFQYIDHLYNTQPPDDPLAEYAKGFEDHLQTPLQPLMDNLESVTYETFEKDPVKYTEYQRAIYLALMDKGEVVGKSTPITVMVVGAGRGPLVRATLNAAESAQQEVKLYAIEKNPQAVLTLRCLKKELWKEKVTVISGDMRYFDPPEKADILVSELLGSFGDNELSPECLDGAQRFLKEDGISIPCSYQSYLGPIQSHKLHSDLNLTVRENNKNPFEMSYIVRLHNVVMPASPQPLFSFVHPNKDAEIDNSRYKILKFNIDYNYVLHGFAGYFDCVLYKDVVLSIYPNSHSPGMFSWFPIFFPIKEPMSLPKGSTLEVHFWRCVSKTKVWYEWLVVQPQVGTVHNPCGRSHSIGLE